MNFLFKKEIIDYEFLKTNSEKTIIFLHGWGGNKNSFIKTIDLLKSEYNILTLTMPTIDRTVEVWSLMDYVNLILALTKIYDINSTIIVCHSFGFRVTTILNHFLKIEKLILTGGAGVRQTNIFNRIENENNKILLRKKSNQFLYKKIASPDYLSLCETNKKTFKNIVNINTKNLLKFDCPILLFWGKNDKETKLFIAKKIMKKNKAKLIVTKGGHFAYLDNNSYFNNMIIEFLK